MKKSYPLVGFPNTLDVLRKAGYSYFRDPLSGEESFVVRLTSEFYPRFHLYVEQSSETVTFNLHLDQKKPSYGSETKHSGEYDGTVVENEMRRIESWVRAGYKQAKSDTSETNPDSVPEKVMGQKMKRWWKKLFGLSER